MSMRALPPPAMAALVAGTAVAGIVAAIDPMVGIALALVAVALAVLATTRMPTLGVVGIGSAAVAAILGPNLALPQAPSAFAFRVLIVLLGVGLIAYVLMDGRLVIPRGLPRPAGLLMALTAWAILSIWWAEDTGAAIRWSFFMVMFTGLAVGIAIACRTRRRAIGLVIALGVTFVVAALVALAELRFGLRLTTSSVVGRTRNEALSASLFGNQNNFATYLTLTLPYFLCLPVVFRDARLMLLGIGGSVATLAALLFTGSRSNLVAAFLILGGLVVLLATDRRRSGRAVAGLVVAGMAILVIVPSLGGGGLIPLPDDAVAKLDVGQLLEQRRAGLGSGAVRASVTTEALAMVGRTDGLGVGAGNAESSIRSLTNFTGVENVHNWWLEVLVNLGVVGFGLYLAFYLTLLRGQLRVSRRTDDPLVRWLGLAGCLALVGFVVGSLGPSSVIHFGPMWITFGLGMLTLVLARRAS